MTGAELSARIGHITHDEATELALTCIGKCFGNAEKPDRRWRASIPVEPADTDVRLMAYLAQQKRFSEAFAALCAWSTSEPEGPAWVTPVLHDGVWKVCARREKGGPDIRADGETAELATIALARALELVP